jgi:hypothetical protein
MAKGFQSLVDIRVKHAKRARGYQRPPKPGLDVCAKPVLQSGFTTKPTEVLMFSHRSLRVA